MAQCQAQNRACTHSHPKSKGLQTHVTNSEPNVTYATRRNDDSQPIFTVSLSPGTTLQYTVQDCGAHALSNISTSEPHSGYYSVLSRWTFANFGLRLLTNLRHSF